MTTFKNCQKINFKKFGGKYNYSFDDRNHYHIVFSPVCFFLLLWLQVSEMNKTHTRYNSP